MLTTNQFAHQITKSLITEIKAIEIKRRKRGNLKKRIRTVAAEIFERENRIGTLRAKNKANETPAREKEMKCHWRDRRKRKLKERKRDTESNRKRRKWGSSECVEWKCLGRLANDHRGMKRRSTQSPIRDTPKPTLRPFLLLHYTPIMAFFSSLSFLTLSSIFQILRQREGNENPSMIYQISNI